METGRHQTIKGARALQSDHKAQAEILLSSIVSPVNTGAGRQTSQVALFGAYIKDVYLPLCRRKWKESTRMTTEPVINNHIRPAFESCNSSWTRKHESTRAVLLNSCAGV
jgi:hypothetical protein